MPIGEVESHPYLLEGAINNVNKLILGSFPVYECTDPDNERKSLKRQEEGTVRFFYGSVDSDFWRLYKTYIDNTIALPPNSNQLIHSLANYGIAISDVIESCQRKQYSSLDTDLVCKTYNSNLFQFIINNGITKILCTSKGVLKLLETQILVNRLNGNNLLNGEFGDLEQLRILQSINGHNDQIKTPIVRVFTINNTNITAISIPSPGSPQRRLKDFGFQNGNWRVYAESYFNYAFTWLNS